MAYIYKITNSINQKQYIGKTTYPNIRWKQHLNESLNKRSSHRALYAAMQKYGRENFTFEIIEEVPEDQVCERECYWIQKYNTYHDGYNETLGGDGRSYLELPEQDICKFYLDSHTLNETAAHFHHDIATIRKVLYKNNIKILNAAEQTVLWRGDAVAQIDKTTDEIIKIFPSVTSADKAMGGNRHVSDVCRGKRKTAYGFKWKYVKDMQD